MSTANVSSASRRYVVVCNKGNFDGYYLRLFSLPEEYENNAERAAWYFLNRLDFQACINADAVLPIETFNEVREVSEKDHPGHAGAFQYVRSYVNRR